MFFGEGASPPTHFELPALFNAGAHFAFGVTGALAGLRRGYDFIGVIVLALITAGGGGLIRDGLLISRGPALILTDTDLLYVVIVAALLTLAFQEQIEKMQRPIAVIDAVGLGAFAVYGVDRSLDAGLSLPASIIAGTLTAVGGGLLRDVLVRDEPLLFKPGQFYAFVAIGGCCLYLGLLRMGLATTNQAAIVTIVLVFATRMLAIRFNWRTSALYRPPAPPPPPPPPSAVEDRQQ